jgi:hypothetical protein
MFLYLCILLNIKGDSSASHRLRFFDKRQFGSNNRTSPLKARALGSVSCPAVSADTDDCSNAHAAVLTKVADAVTDTDILGADIDTIVDGYLTECIESQCQPDCVNLFTTYQAGVADDGIAVFGEAFAQNCPLPPETITNSVDCPSTSSDDSTCTSLYNEVLAELGKPNWVGATIKSKIDSFTSKCSVTSCVSTCKDAVSSVHVESKFTSLANAFASSCRPIVVIIETTDENQETSENHESSDNNPSDDDIAGLTDDKNAGNYGFLHAKASPTSLFILIGSSLLYSLLSW